MVETSNRSALGVPTAAPIPGERAEGAERLTAPEAGPSAAGAEPSAQDKKGSLGEAEKVRKEGKDKKSKKAHTERGKKKIPTEEESREWRRPLKRTAKPEKRKRQSLTKARESPKEKDEESLESQQRDQEPSQKRRRCKSTWTDTVRTPRNFWSWIFAHKGHSRQTFP